MGARLLRIAMAFGIVLTTYTVYALTAVRLIEPSADAVARTKATDDDLANAHAKLDRTQALLAPHFPPGSWELNKPKVLESDRAKLLVDKYENLPDGRVKLFPCTVLFFSDDAPDAPNAAPPVIMQAPEGAILQFDEPFDLKRAKIGRLIGGQLVGRVTIRRAATHPGAADELRITTRDIELSEERVTTPHAVDFHFGPSNGSGRELKVLLARKEKLADGKKSATIVGVKSFELVHDVRMHMLFGGKDPQRSAQSLVTGKPEVKTVRRTNDPPLEITCQGPFHFDPNGLVATFTDKVDVLRLNANGPSDQLNCELLAIYFSQRNEAPDKPAPTPGKPALKDNKPPSLQARLIEARGDPVIIRSPSTGGQARCQRLEYEIETGRISLAGAGMLQGAVPTNPGQKYQARWSKELRLEPQGAEQMLSLVGGAQVRLSDIGRSGQRGVAQPASLGADEIHVWVTSPPRAATPANGSTARTQPTAASGALANPGLANPNLAGDIRPRRLVAQGAVRIESPQLTGATGRLEAAFVPAVTPASPSASLTSLGSGPQRGGAPGAEEAPRQQQFHVGGSQLWLQFAVRGQQTELSDVTLEGNANLTESKTAKPGEQPLVVKGDRLQVAHADGPDASVNVVGQPALVQARGLSLSGANIQMLRRTNRLWIDGVGRMMLPMNQDLRGRAAASAGPQQLEVAWQGRMEFDGHRAQFERAVVARSQTQLLKTEKLDVTLKRTIDFGNPTAINGPTGDRSSQAGELDQLVCSGGVFFENRSFDERGLSSIDRLQTLDLAINQTTGGIDAHGPGWVSTVRRGQPTGAGGRPGAKPKPDATAAANAAEQISFLSVTFARSITGNMNQRELTMADQVKGVYGPVPGWEDKLDPDAPEKLGAAGMALSCDQLTLREMADRAERKDRGSIELEAQGNTVIEGTDFTARAHRLTYAEKKSLVVLEGDGRSDAQLFRQPVPGGPTSQAAARRIMYWQSTKRVEVDDARFFDFGQFNAGQNKEKAGQKSDGPVISPAAAAGAKMGPAAPVSQLRKEILRHPSQK